MKKRLIKYPLADGNDILIEVEYPGIEDVTRSHRTGMIEEATEKFEDMLRQIKPVTAAIISTLREIGDSPDEASVEFGVKLNANSGIILASAGVEANFVFKLTWKRKETGVA
jgi:Trypsin-co-occurring domain 1